MVTFDQILLYGAIATVILMVLGNLVSVFQKSWTTKYEAIAVLVLIFGMLGLGRIDPESFPSVLMVLLGLMFSFFLIVEMVIFEMIIRRKNRASNPAPSLIEEEEGDASSVDVRRIYLWVNLLVLPYFFVVMILFFLSNFDYAFILLYASPLYSGIVLPIVSREHVQHGFRAAVASFSILYYIGVGYSYLTCAGEGCLVSVVLLVAGPAIIFAYAGLTFMFSWIGGKLVNI